MLTVIVEAGENPEAVARTLAGLVPAAVEGVVRDVHIVAGSESPALKRVVDTAGARLWPSGRLADAINAARAEWLLVLEPGARLNGEWMDAVAAHCGASHMPARFRKAKGGRRFAWFGARASALSRGLVIAKAQAIANMRGRRSAEALASGLAVRTLDVELTPPV